MSGAWTPPAWATRPCHALGWVAWALRMPPTQGEAAELPEATAGHCHPTYDHGLSIHPSVPTLLSPITFFLCPSLCPKSTTSVPPAQSPAPEPYSSISCCHVSSSPVRRDNPAPTLTCSIPRWLAARSHTGFPGSCCPSTTPTSTAGPRGRQLSAGGDKRGVDSRARGCLGR